MNNEQWEQLIRYYRLVHGERAAQGLIEARRFQDSMNTIQSDAGHTQEQIDEISQALLALANEVDDNE